jgi:hypothetical protein
MKYDVRDGDCYLTMRDVRNLRLRLRFLAMSSNWYGIAQMCPSAECTVICCSLEGRLAFEAAAFVRNEPLTEAPGLEPSSPVTVWSVPFTSDKAKQYYLSLYINVNARRYVCPEKKANPLLDEVESWNLAGLQRDRPNQREKSKTRKSFPRVSEMVDGIVSYLSKKLTHFFMKYKAEISQI